MLHNNVLIRCYGCFARNIILTVVFFFITIVLLIRRGVRVFRWLEGRRTSVPKHSATEAPHAACKYNFPRLSTGHDLTRGSNQVGPGQEVLEISWVGPGPPGVLQIPRVGPGHPDTIRSDRPPRSDLTRGKLYKPGILFRRNPRS